MMKSDCFLFNKHLLVVVIVAKYVSLVWYFNLFGVLLAILDVCTYAHMRCWIALKYNLPKVQQIIIREFL